MGTLTSVSSDSIKGCVLGKLIFLKLRDMIRILDGVEWETRRWESTCEEIGGQPSWLYFGGKQSDARQGATKHAKMASKKLENGRGAAQGRLGGVCV